MTDLKRLYRSDTNKILAGIIGGISEYFEIDPTIIRLGFIVLLLVTAIFPAVITYIFALFIVPRKPFTPSPINTTIPKNHFTPTTAPTQKTSTQTFLPIEIVQPELQAMEITMEHNEKYKPGERPAPEVTSQLAVPPENDYGLRKPLWPNLPQTIIHDEHPILDQKTTTLDSLIQERDEVGLDDLINE